MPKITFEERIDGKDQYLCFERDARVVVTDGVVKFFPDSGHAADAILAKQGQKVRACNSDSRGRLYRMTFGCRAAEEPLVA
jgi:hypothetical protein